MLEETKLESIDLVDSQALTSSEAMEATAEDVLPDSSPATPVASPTVSSLPALLEAIILAAGRPISEEEMLKLFVDFQKPTKKELRVALKELQDSCEPRGITLVEIASGYQFHVKLEWAPVVARLWEEKAPKYSRALFETLALIAYRQPITRGEIEEIRGVSLSLSIFKTLLEEREWIRVVGHKEVPGRPALYATTKNFLDYFGLKSLEELPSLPEIMNLDSVELPEAALEALKRVGIELRSVPNEKQAIETEMEASEEDSEAYPEDEMDLDETNMTDKIH